MERGRLGLIALFTAPIAVVLWLSAPRDGLGVSYDSVVYASSRRVLDAGGGWSFSSLWPPGLPAVLAVTGTGWGAVLLNCALLAANLAAIYVLARLVSGSRPLAVVAAAWCGLSIAMIQSHSMLWSEPAFYLCINLALLAAVHIQRAGQLRPWSTVGLIVAVNMACLFRYSGAAAIGFAGVAAALALAPRTRWRALVPAAGVAAASSIVFVAVLAQHRAAGEPMMGVRWPSMYSPAEVVGQLLSAVGAFALNMPYASGRAILGALLLGAAATGAVFWFRRIGARQVIRTPEAVLLAWVGLYVAFLLASAARTYIDQIDYRLLLPAQSAVVILVCLAAQSIKGRRVLAGVVVGAVGATTVGWALFVGATIPSLHTMEETWSAVPELVNQTIPADAPVVSNVPQIIAATTGRDSLAGFPDAGPKPPTTVPDYVPSTLTQPRILNYIRPGDYIVWFGDLDRDPSWVLLGDGGDVKVYRAP